MHRCLTSFCKKTTVCILLTHSSFHENTHTKYAFLSVPFYQTGGENLLYGFDGDDSLFGGDERDFISGGNGNDYIYGNNFVVSEVNLGVV